jgi:hypothetical protein
MKLNHSDFQQMHFTKKIRNIEINCVKCANHHQSFLHKKTMPDSETDPAI